MQGLDHGAHEEAGWGRELCELLNRCGQQRLREDVAPLEARVHSSNDALMGRAEAGG